MIFLKTLVGKTYHENELYELLTFELEESFDQKFSDFIHIYFERIENQKIKITELVYFKDSKEMNKKSRQIIEKKEWFELNENHGHLNLFLVRFDRTGFASSIWKDRTHTEPWSHGWADEGPPRARLTPEEIRLAFQELAGVFENQQEIQKLKSKKTV